SGLVESARADAVAEPAEAAVPAPERGSAGGAAADDVGTAASALQFVLGYITVQDSDAICFEEGVHYRGRAGLLLAQAAMAIVDHYRLAFDAVAHISASAAALANPFINHDDLPPSRARRASGSRALRRSRPAR